jgi:hypothetical protein
MDGLKKFVLNAVESLSGVGFVIVILYSAISGASSGGFFGFLGGIIIGFIAAIIIFGIIFLLMDINENIKKQNKS